MKQLSGWLWEKFNLGGSAGPSLRAYGSAPAGCWRLTYIVFVVFSWLTLGFECAD